MVKHDCHGIPFRAKDEQLSVTVTAVSDEYINSDHEQKFGMLQCEVHFFFPSKMKKEKNKKKQKTKTKNLYKICNLDAYN